MAPSGGVYTTLLVRVCTGFSRRGLHPPLFVGTCSRFSLSSSRRAMQFSRWFPSAPLPQTPVYAGPCARRSVWECTNNAQPKMESQ